MEERSSTVTSAVKDRAMDVAPVGIVLSDPHQEDNPLIYVNDTFTEITGYPRDEILERNCRFLQGPETDPEAVRQMRDAIDDKSAVTVEVRNYRYDGEPFWNEVTIAPVHDEDGKLLHFVGFQSDVTDRKEAELALEQRTDELEHLIDRLDGLLHDITEELMHATSREETELAICERIVSTPPYRFAWVGTLDPVTETVEPTNHDGELSQWKTGAIDGSAAGVIGEALDDGNVEIVTDRALLDDLLAPESISTAAIIPLRYRQQRYGVLVLGVESSDTLEPPEVTVLESLGRTIATAIHAAQTRRQLAEDTRVVATFILSDRSFPLYALAEATDADFEFEGAIEHRDGSASMFLTTQVDITTLETAIGTIDALTDIAEINDLGERRLIEITEGEPAIVPWLAQLGASISTLSISEKQARMELELLPTVDGRAVIETIQSRFEGAELIGYRVEERPPITRDEFLERVKHRLTDRQLLVLKRAYLSGFYDPNRQTTGTELAESMDLSRSTFHQHRRAAERKLIEEFFG